MEWIKLFAFSAVLVFAAIVDVRQRQVSKWTYLALTFVGAINVGIYSLVGAAVCFLPLLLYAVWTDGIGGGDVKLCGMIGFCQGTIGGLCGIFLGMALAVVITPILHKRKGIPATSSFALVPYLAAGSIVSATFITLL